MSLDQRAASKAKRELLLQKQVTAEKERLCEFYSERCIQLELRMARERLKGLPRAAKDSKKYVGNELIERDLLIDRLMGELALCHADIKLLKQSNISLPSENESVYGTRFPRQLELGPTSTYK